MPNQSCSQSYSACRSLQKQISRDPGGGVGSGISTNTPTITLDSIITEYLTNQHALCKNPMVTCPQFNLLECVLDQFLFAVVSLTMVYVIIIIIIIFVFRPHKCPDPCTKNSTPTNLTVRLNRRSLGFDGRKLDRRHIYSRFCPVKTFRPTDVDGTFTCCTFSVSLL